MMRRLALVVWLASCAQGAGGAPVNTPERKERILEHIKGRYKELAGVDLELSDFTRQGGMDQAQMTLRGGQGPKQTILASPDDKVVYFVMGEPIDASGSIASLRAEREQEVANRKTELVKLAQGQPVRGNPEALVTIIEFSDFQCPYCRRGTESMDQLLERYPKDVKLVFLHYPLPFHDWAKPAAVAAICAARQEPKSFWTLHDALFAEQKDITAANVMDKSEKALASTGVDLKKWASCAKSDGPENKSAHAEVEAAMAAGQKLGVDGTPAFFINGELVTGAVPVEELERVVKNALGQKS